jgi:putative FmdB family regulatory protein
MESEEVRAVPIYEYKCLQCGEVFEAFQKIDDQPLHDCKFCQGKVEKLISHTSFQLKGSGWYLTDYAKKSQPAHTEVKDTTKTSDKAASSPEKASASASKTGDSST